MIQIPEDAIKCLDKGFVRLVDSMGGDDAIVQAARVSYGQGTSKVSQDRGLIRYLMRHRHTTPFEMVEFKFHCKMPIFVARQWVRHRTANQNEYSLRYSGCRIRTAQAIPRPVIETHAKPRTRKKRDTLKVAPASWSAVLCTAL